MFFVYILKSLKDGNLYMGSTNNLVKRLEEHNSGRSISTKSRRPLKYIYFEGYLSETDARKREHNLKLGGRALAQLKKRIVNTLEI